MVDDRDESADCPSSEEVVRLIPWILTHGAAHVRALRAGMRMPRVELEQPPEPAADELDAQALARMIRIALRRTGSRSAWRKRRGSGLRISARSST